MPRFLSPLKYLVSRLTQKLQLRLCQNVSYSIDLQILSLRIAHSFARDTTLNVEAEFKTPNSGT